MKRRKTLEALVAWSLSLGEAQPVLVLVEDLQWCDPSSLELLSRMIVQSGGARMMLVCTARPDFRSTWPTLSNVTLLHLGRLTKRQTREMVAALSPGRVMPEAVVNLIVARADAIPLYVEELSRMVLESGLLVESDGHLRLEAPLTELAIPTTLHDSLMARLDRLGSAKEVAQRAAVLGRDFAYALLAATAGLDDHTLRQGLARLADAEVLFQRGQPPDAAYTFKHALIQQAAYGSLMRRTRQQLHARVAKALLEQPATQTEAPPEMVGRHYEAAGLTDHAVTQYRRAAARAAARSAHQEATSHLRRGIGLLTTLPDGVDRDGREALLQIALGLSLIAARGYAHPETGAVFERARALFDAVQDPAQRAAAFLGLSVFHTIRGEPQLGADLARTQLALARATADTDYLLLAHVQIAVPELYQGNFASSLVHCEEAIAIYDPSRHGPRAHNYGADQGVAALANAGWNLWYLGYPDRALGRVQDAVALARTLGHPFTLAFSLFDESVIHWFRREPEAQLAKSEEAIALSEAQGFPLWLGVSKVLRGAARACMQADAATIAEVSEGLALTAETGAQAGAPGLLALLAETHQALKESVEAIASVDMGLTIAARTGQSHWNAELHRLKGELLLVGPSVGAAEAEACFRRALDIARAQEARSLELRAATSLARLLYAQHQSSEARNLLTPLYAWFTEGFETRDLREAKAILIELG